MGQYRIHFAIWHASVREMIRVAFTLIGGEAWTGGRHYLLNLLGVLLSYQSEKLQPVLLLGEDVEDGDLDPFLKLHGLTVVRDSALNEERRRWRLFQAVAVGRDYAIKRLLHDQKIDVLFEAAQFFGWRIGVPTIAWIPDFQHRNLPNLFSRAAWWRREIGFRMQVVSGRFIMLSSEDARQSCEFFYPPTIDRTRAVRFATHIRHRVTVQKSMRVADSYGLPREFVYLPNQFWKHKNHHLVLEALTILREQGRGVVIAASGKQEDPRDPSYFPDFLAELKRRELSDSFRMLGLIPYADVLALLRACSALLNPSLFEGWSTTVEEAKAMGTPMVLSDLQVHKEQAGEGAIFFDRRSACALAEALMSLPDEDAKGRELAERRARLDSHKRLNEFALGFAEVAEACIKGAAE